MQFLVWAGITSRAGRSRLTHVDWTTNPVGVGLNERSLTESVLHLIFDPYGAVERIGILSAKSRIVVFIKYGSDHDAARAYKSLHGRNIYDGCCQLDITEC